jgi:hypothetical protein
MTVSTMPPPILTVMMLTMAIAGTASARPASGPDRIWYDGIDDTGRLIGGVTELQVEIEPGLRLPYEVETLLDNGPVANRIDYVFVGDGYLASQLDAYAGHVLGSLGPFFDESPFDRYQSYFNIHRVDVISNESGVDHDPTQGIYRDTALDMGFWCSGIERLLCVNVNKAWAAAGNAPDADTIFAVANSTKYGGAGYTSSEVATFSGGNDASPEVALHELGHSLGNLADEYDYGDGSTYNGPEVGEVNVSIRSAAEMTAAETKWYRWLGFANPAFDGLHDAYEGARYYQYGINRPTGNSKMRSLGRPFNAPSVEAIIAEFYRIVDPIDDATPNGEPLVGTETVFVETLQPVGAPLRILWTIDDAPVGNEPSLDLLSLGLTEGTYALAVTVSDPTELVRDPDIIATLLTQTISWTLYVPIIGDIDGSGCVDLSDLGRLLASFEIDDGGDVDGDGDTDLSDLGALLAHWNEGC